MPGYFTPGPTFQNVSDNGTTTFNGTYEQAVGAGKIEVTSNPSGATFILMGTDNFTGTTPWNVDNATAGSYCIMWNDMPGYFTPPSYCQDVTDKGTTEFQGQ